MKTSATTKRMRKNIQMNRFHAVQQNKKKTFKVQNKTKITNENE